MPYYSVGFDCQMPLLMNPDKKNCIHWLLNVLDNWKHDESGLSWLVSPQRSFGRNILELLVYYLMLNKRKNLKDMKSSCLSICTSSLYNNEGRYFLHYYM